MIIGIASMALASVLAFGTYGLNGYCALEPIFFIVIRCILVADNKRELALSPSLCQGVHIRTADATVRDRNLDIIV